MSVISLKTNYKQAANVQIQAGMYGIEAEVIEAEEPNEIFIDLIGSEEKARYVAEKTGAEIVDIVDRVAF